MDLLVKTNLIATGQRFGHWEVIGAPFRVRERSTLRTCVVCKCDCGHLSILESGQLRYGKSLSCGCERKNRTTHGLSGLPEYSIWCGMIGRCCNPNNPAYADYGGRGITVCDSWRESFEAFYDDMGPRPSEEQSLDRFPDNNGNYEPGNCRWATHKEQSRNRRSSRYLTANGVTKTVAEWAEEIGVKTEVLVSRIHAGWCDEDVVNRQIRRRVNG